MAQKLNDQLIRVDMTKQSVEIAPARKVAVDARGAKGVTLREEHRQRPSPDVGEGRRTILGAQGPLDEEPQSGPVVLQGDIDIADGQHRLSGAQGETRCSRKDHVFAVDIRA